MNAAQINLIIGNHQPKSIFLHGRNFTIGRDSENDLVLPYRFVLHKHGAFVYSAKDGQYFDLNSTNGTFFNGKLVKKLKSM